MKNIKIVGALVFVILVILALIFTYISKEEQKFNNYINIINNQKSLTQEIAKNVLYMNKNGSTYSEQLDKNINMFIANKKKRTVKEQNIVRLWDEFYVLVNEYKKRASTTVMYSYILLDKIVSDIYKKNLDLIVELDKRINEKRVNFNNLIQLYKNIQYLFFILLILLILYLITQMREIVNFVLQFLKLSEKIKKNLSIKDIEQFETKVDDKLVKEATENINSMIVKLNTSINIANTSIINTTRSIENIESNVESLMEVFTNVDNNNSKISRKEDTVIDSLETIIQLNEKLKNLSKDIKELISVKNY